nr:hypothetical protein [Pantoea sp. F_5]
MRNNTCLRDGNIQLENILTKLKRVVSDNILQVNPILVQRRQFLIMCVRVGFDI